MKQLHRWNVGLTVLHAGQAVAVLVLGGSFAITVTSSVPVGPPGSLAVAPERLFDVRIAWAVALFLLLAAADHLLTATWLRRRYETDLRRGINRFRWVEYSVSATLMVIGYLRGYSGVQAGDETDCLRSRAGKVGSPPGRIRRLWRMVRKRTGVL